MRQTAIVTRRRQLPPMATVCNYIYIYIYIYIHMYIYIYTYT